MEYIIAHPIMWLVMALGCSFLAVVVQVMNMKYMRDNHEFPWLGMGGVALCGLGATAGWICLVISVIAYIARTAG